MKVDGFRFVLPILRGLIRKAFKSDGAVSEYARRELRDQRDAEFDLMLAELWGNAGPTGDMSKVAA